MRASTFAVAVTLAGMAACSKGQSYSDDSLARDLDLALSQQKPNRAVVSAVEGGQKPKPEAQAAPYHSHVAEEVAHARQRPSPERAPVAVNSDEVAPDPVQESTADAAAPDPVPDATTETTTTPDPEPARDPAPDPVPSGRGGGGRLPGGIGWPGGIGLPGGGVIIIRGGRSGEDPCDLDHPGHEGRGGRRGGGILINPTFPGGRGGIGGVILR